MIIIRQHRHIRHAYRISSSQEQTASESAGNVRSLVEVEGSDTCTSHTHRGSAPMAPRGWLTSTQLLLQRWRLVIFTSEEDSREKQLLSPRPWVLQRLGILQWGPRRRLAASLTPNAFNKVTTTTTRFCLWKGWISHTARTEIQLSHDHQRPAGTRCPLECSQPYYRASGD